MLRVLVAVCIGLSLACPASADTATFAADAVGAPPAAWTVTKTGRGNPKWTVEVDPTAPSKGRVLKQSGVATYPLALKTGTAIKDGYVQTQFKAIGGKEDRAAGVVWRAKDANNYYVARANALEDNVVLYKTVAGNRIELNTVKGDTYGLKVPVPANQWHVLRVEFAGSGFKVIYNSKLLFEVNDATFKDAGMVGVWTKADSVTLFDGLEYGGTP